MEKEFIPYNEALALKELGFDEPCFMTYLNGKLDKELFLFNHSIRSHSTQEFTSAPLYQQCWRWFREKHNLECHIKSLYEQRENKGFYFGVADTYRDFYSKPYYSYEEAELECLKKLIEIVKAKNKNEEQK